MTLIDPQDTAVAGDTRNASAAIIEVRDLRKAFDKHVVLAGLNWSVAPGQLVGLLGRNGAGKSTLIRCLLGLSPIDGGKIEVFGEPVDAHTPETLHRIGYVPQSFDLFPWMRVKQYLAFTRAFYTRWNASFAEELLSRWEVDPGKRIGELSQGQRQKLAIIRAIAPDPDLLVLDEPVASLDPQTRRLFLDELLKLARRAGKTVIFSTHITTDLERADARIALLKDGRIAFIHTLDELKARVRRVVLRGPDLPEFHLAPDVLRYARDGELARVVVDGHDDARIAELAARFNATATIEAMSLEDIFIELG
jgi:ABC-2 type transport system ATP-binding protein